MRPWLEQPRGSILLIIEPIFPLEGVEVAFEALRRGACLGRHLLAM